MSTVAFSSNVLPTTRRRPRPIHRQVPRLSTRRAPRTFVRLSPGPNNTTLLQTSITTFSSRSSSHTGVPRSLDLYAVLHIADASYYKQLQHDLSGISNRIDGAVLYELILPSSLSHPTSIPGLREVQARVRAPPDASRRASRMDAVAQADFFDPSLPRWYLADLSSEKVTALSRELPPRVPSPAPLQLVAAMLPCPELFAGAVPLPSRGAGLLARALARGDVPSARRVAFARKAVASTAARVYAAADTVTAARDAAAVAAVKSTGKAGANQVALVYGAWHAGHLCRRAEDELGLKFVRTRWRTAMVLPAGGGGVGALAFGAILAAIYILYAGLDWVITVKGVVSAVEQGVDSDVVAKVVELVGWYAVRHFLPYVGFQSWFDVGDAE